ncbi:MAG: DNA-binding response OmpR family regulator [Planctomycetota bacterium]|jgi:DNA-binding response OmpR family regulator
MSDQQKIILFAEDELLVREAARMALEDENYTVLLADNGDEAIGIFVDRYEDIDLVLLDVQMPGMNGDEALKQMQFIDPAVNVIFVTGVIIDWEELGVAGIIQKPYGTGELLRRVKGILTPPQPLIHPNYLLQNRLYISNSGTCK